MTALDIKELLDLGDTALTEQQLLAAETYYATALREADLSENTAAKCIALEKLADALFAQEHFEDAAKCYCGALAINKTSIGDEESHTRIHSKYELVKSSFLASIQSSFISTEQALYELRSLTLTSLSESISGISPIVQMQRIFHLSSETIKYIFSKEFYSALGKIGPPPCSFYVAFLGSLGRGESTPFSDLEFAVITEEARPDITEYFANITRLMNLELMRLLETDINDHHNPLLQSVLLLNTKPTLKATAVDQGDKTPAGKIALVGNGAAFARHLNLDDLNKNAHLVQALLTAESGFGEKRLFDEFRNAMHIRLGTKANGFSLRRWHLLSCLEEDFAKFDSQKKLQELHAGVSLSCKQDLYRPVNRIIENLSLLYLPYHCQAGLSSFEKLDSIAKQGDISTELACSLKLAFANACRIRTRLYCLYGEQHEQINLSILAEFGELGNAIHLLETCAKAYEHLSEITSVSTVPVTPVTCLFSSVDALLAPRVIRSSEADGSLLITREVLTENPDASASPSF